VRVLYFVQVLHHSRPGISRHLAYMRRSGIARPRKEEKWVRYSIAFLLNPPAAAILRKALLWTANMPIPRVLEIVDDLLSRRVLFQPLDGWATDKDAA
jgi:hypothetical protein